MITLELKFASYQLSSEHLSQPVPFPLPQHAAEQQPSLPPCSRPAASPAQQLLAPPLLAFGQLLEQLPQQLLSQLQPVRQPPSWQLPLLQLASQLQPLRQLLWQPPAEQPPALLPAAGQLLQLCASGSLPAKPTTRHNPHTGLQRLRLAQTAQSGLIGSRKTVRKLVSSVVLAGRTQF